MKKFAYFGTFFAILLSSCFVQANISLNSTRVIYDAKQKEASISVINKSDKLAYLVQSWIDDINDKKQTDFIVTPPLFRLNQAQTNALRIIRVGGSLPDDKESVFWLNIKSIPGTEQNDSNRLLIAIKNKIKLFYRPTGIQGNVYDAYKNVAFSVQGNKLVVKNSSNYYLTFAKIAVDNVTIKDPRMIAPQSSDQYVLPKTSATKVTWSIVNDYGGETKELSAPISR